MKYPVLALITSSLISGCSSIPANRTVDSTAATTFLIEPAAENGRTTAAVKAANQKTIETKLEEVLNFCLPRLSGYEKSSAKQARNSYWLSLSGLVAGTVIGPALTAANSAANAASIAAFSGWAGATNFAGQALKSSGLSGSSIAETRNGIIKNVREAIAVASDGTLTFDLRRGALMRARSECILYEIAIPSLPQAN